MLRVIGLMSGTSLDGVDAAWLETDGERIGAFGPRLTIQYDDRLRSDLRRLLDLAPTLAADDRRVKTAAARLTEYHARAVAAIGRPADLIGFHGQTILHQPDRSQPGRGRTWQIGDAAWLAWRTGARVAWDFRSADVAAGGEGAPFAPAYHAALAGELPQPLAVLNIGGVANVTWIGGTGSAATGSAATVRCWRATPARATARWMTGSRATLGRRSTRTAPWRGRARWIRRCSAACWTIRILPGPLPSRWIGLILPGRSPPAGLRCCRRRMGLQLW